MSPGKSYELNGPRPSPLLIHKDSRLIRKPSPPQQLRQPLIIYTHSPKIIHTHPKDFMALVQRLTGFTPPPPPPPPRPHQETNPNFVIVKDDNNNNNNNNNDSSSALTDDDSQRSSGVKEVQSNSFFSDLPLFTPPYNNAFSPSFLHFLKGLPDF